MSARWGVWFTWTGVLQVPPPSLDEMKLTLSWHVEKVQAALGYQ